MNGITSLGQDPGSNGMQSLPPSAFDRLDRLDDAFAPADPNVSISEWLDQARTSTNPAMQAYYQELVTLAGGRTDDAALTQVIARFQDLASAVTQSEVQAADRGMMSQIETMLNRFDPIDRLLDAVQPQLANLTREAGLGNTQWGTSLQRVLDAPGSLGAFRDGVRAGVVAGASDMVVGTLELVGRGVQYGLDNARTSPIGPTLGEMGDVLRSATGGLPSVLNEVVPSAQRGQATSEALANMGEALGNYISAVAADPGRLRNDVVNAINAQWSQLEASHAAAVAQGPQAEARWWGETVGRVTFEVAVTFVPVAGQAGRGARMADTAGDLADTASDAARIVAPGGDEAADAARVAAGGVDEAADVGVTTSRVAAAVRPLEVGNYGDLAARSVRDDMTPDHIPSFAAVRTHIEAQIDGTLTPAQLRELRNNTTAIVYDTSLHQQASRTYGGRNSATQIAGDASNLRAAAEADMARIRPELIAQGMSPADVDAAFDAIHRANIELGLYE